MVDIHTHILSGVDDGSSSYEESVKIIEQAKKHGVTDIILTPHYINNSEYASTYSNNTKLLYNLSKDIKGINLYIGNEYYLCDDIHNLLETNIVRTLNDSKYFLIELPLTTNINNLNEVIFHLRSKGIIPIIAHPERYLMFQREPKSIFHVLEHGALLQCNVGSLFGKYGRKCEKTIKKFIKEEYIQFIATDVHHEKQNVYKLIQKAYEKIASMTTREYADELFIKNGKNVIKNEDVEYIPKENKY